MRWARDKHFQCVCSEGSEDPLPQVPLGRGSNPNQNGEVLNETLSARDRESALNAKCAPKEFDLAIVGGGITGAGVARDAASRGLKVALIEGSDFASGTSSRSSKLIHGGIRYLENLEFGLVFEALSERTRLFELAPHLVHPLRFLLAHLQIGPGSGMENGPWECGSTMRSRFLRRPNSISFSSVAQIAREFPALQYSKAFTAPLPITMPIWTMTAWCWRLCARPMRFGRGNGQLCEGCRRRV